jgi:hypothetical protein
MSPSPRWSIEVVNGQDPKQRAAVERLRRRACVAAPELRRADPATLGWSDADERGVVLGLWAGAGSGGDTPVLLSTLRLSVLARAAAAEVFLQHALGGVGVRWPALVLSGCATEPGSGGHGLMAMLRWAYLHALPDGHLRSVLAVVYEDAPRLRSMQAVGYTLTVPTSSWDSEASALRAPLVAHLAAAHFDAARAAASRLVLSALPLLQVQRTEIADALLCLSLQAAQPEPEPEPAWRQAA